MNFFFFFFRLLLTLVSFIGIYHFDSLLISTKLVKVTYFGYFVDLKVVKKKGLNETESLLKTTKSKREKGK